MGHIIHYLAKKERRQVKKKFEIGIDKDGIKTKETRSGQLLHVVQ